MRHALVLAVAAALVAGCSPATDAPAADQDRAPAPTPALEPSPPFPVAELELIGPDDEAVAVPVLVAATRPARQRGLMGRDHLPAGSGMVFLYDEDVSSGFWMKDTLLPLSIAFFDVDGEVQAVLDMEPCPADPCPVYDPGVTYRVALEVNQGFFDEIGVGAGWRVDLPPDLRSRAGLD